MRKILKNLSIMCIVFVSLILSGCEHIHIYNKTIVAPTESSQGYEKYTCSCGDEEIKNYTYLLTFSSENYFLNKNNKTLPSIENQIVESDSTFLGVKDIDGFTAVEYMVLTENDYYNIFVGDKIESSYKIQIVWDEIDREKTQEEQNFDNLLSKIKKLEELSNEYNVINNKDKDPILRVLQYIKKQKYNGYSWNLISGDVEAEFITYVSEQDSSLAELQNIDNFIVPKTGEEIDFVHMVALMNVAYKSPNEPYTDLGGWLGDVCQLAAQINQMNLSTDAEIYAKCDELYNSTQGGLSKYDLLADLDGLNLIKFHNYRGNTSIYETIKSYYTIINTTKRKTNFIDNTLNGTTDKTILTETIQSRVYNNILIKTWCNNNSLDLTQEKSKKIVNHLIDLTINYLVD